MSHHRAVIKLFEKALSSRKLPVNKSARKNLVRRIARKSNKTFMASRMKLHDTLWYYVEVILSKYCLSVSPSTTLQCIYRTTVGIFFCDLFKYNHKKVIFFLNIPSAVHYSEQLFLAVEVARGGY